jgi:PIN domain nuclease of toxin-antitoxin system
MNLMTWMNLMVNTNKISTHELKRTHVIKVMKLEYMDENDEFHPINTNKTHIYLSIYSIYSIIYNIIPFSPY